jgi:hypothetical protein
LPATTKRKPGRPKKINTVEQEEEIQGKGPRRSPRAKQQTPKVTPPSSPNRPNKRQKKENVEKPRRGRPRKVNVNKQNPGSGSIKKALSTKTKGSDLMLKLNKKTAGRNTISGGIIGIEHYLRHGTKWGHADGTKEVVVGEFCW